jgi:hypothetical protein
LPETGENINNPNYISDIYVKKTALKLKNSFYLKNIKALIDSFAKPMNNA